MSHIQRLSAVTAIAHLVCVSFDSKTGARSIDILIAEPRVQQLMYRLVARLCLPPRAARVGLCGRMDRRHASGASISATVLEKRWNARSVAEKGGDQNSSSVWPVGRSGFGVKIESNESCRRTSRGYEDDVGGGITLGEGPASLLRFSF